MRVAVTGGSGLVGRFIVRRLAAEGHAVVVLGRTPLSDAPAEGIEHRRFDLEAAAAAPLDGLDALVHAALDHAPGRYRGGEGTDPAGFLSRNLGGTIALFRAARAAGVSRVVFLSSRAVYGDYPAGTCLTEDLPPRPDTLYGHVKREAEAALDRLARPGFAGTSLRVTGVYGPATAGRRHKWADLFDAVARGETVAPRVGTEVHGDDAAAAVATVLDAAAPPRCLNVSDIVLDRADLVAAFARVTGIEAHPPERADAAQVSVMDTARLRALGWRPRGRPGFDAAMPALAAAWRTDRD